MPDMDKLAAALPEGVDPEQVMDALKEAGYKVEPADATGEPPEGEVSDEGPGAMKDKKKEEEDEETPFRQADHGEQLARTDAFLKEYEG